jgi:hypothetical protein
MQEGRLAGDEDLTPTFKDAKDKQSLLSLLFCGKK